MASIFAQLGFDGLLLGRIDYQDKEFRFQRKTAEMVWEASHNLGKIFPPLNIMYKILFF